MLILVSGGRWWRHWTTRWRRWRLSGTVASRWKRRGLAFALERGGHSELRSRVSLSLFYRLFRRPGRWCRAGMCRSRSSAGSR